MKLPSLPCAACVVGSAASGAGAAEAESAAQVLPRPSQTAWMRLERTFFIHFGPNTFRGVEWGSGREDPSIFHPTALDAGQWVRTINPMTERHFPCE